jgi:hypothetical protein
MDIFGNPDILDELYDEDIATLVQLALDQVEELLGQENGKGERRKGCTSEEALLDTMKEELEENAVKLSDRATARRRQEPLCFNSPFFDSDSDSGSDSSATSSSSDDDPISWEEFSNLYRSWRKSSRKSKDGEISGSESFESSTKKPRRRRVIRKAGTMSTYERADSPVSTVDPQSTPSHAVEAQGISESPETSNDVVLRDPTIPRMSPTWEPGVPVTYTPEDPDTLLSDQMEESNIPEESPELIHSRPIRSRIILRPLRPVTPELFPPLYPDDIIKSPTFPDDQ